MVSLLNKAGYFSQPTAGNVAVALTKAKINTDLTQNLESVYTNPDPRAYPMSSYSYMVVPTTTAAPFNTDKGKTLSTFVNYFLCTGQQKADILGLLAAAEEPRGGGLQAGGPHPRPVASPSINQCNNPALNILHSAPMPDKCMKLGLDLHGVVHDGHHHQHDPNGTTHPAVRRRPDTTAPGSPGTDQQSAGPGARTEQERKGRSTHRGTGGQRGDHGRR